MGMFDYVYVDQPGFDPDRSFQTKDFDMPYMNRYDITKAGRLVFTDWPKDDDIPGKAPVDTNFHGILNFYDYRGDKEGWTEYNAKFTDGVLVNIAKVEGT
jgi:hypothetical protein